MYFYESSKIAGALLAAFVLALALTGVSDRIFAHGKPGKPAYVIAAATEVGNAPSASPAASASPRAAAPETAAAETATAALSESRSVEPSAAVASVAPSAESSAPEPAGAAVTAEGKNSDAKSCLACDAAEKHAAATAGPPLFAIAGRPKSSMAELAHSGSLKPQAVNWTDSDLDRFLASPNGFAASALPPGAEADAAAKRADMAAYLRTLADHPGRARAK